MGPPATTNNAVCALISPDEVKQAFMMSTEPAGPKSFRPAGDVPITMLSVMVVRGQNLATFTAQVLISPAGPTAEQTKGQLITLVRGIGFRHHAELTRRRRKLPRTLCVGVARPT